MFVILPLGHESAQVRRVPWVTIGIVVICFLLQFRATFADDASYELGEIATQIATIQQAVVSEETDPEVSLTLAEQDEVIAQYRAGELGEEDDPRREQLDLLEERAMKVMAEDPVLGLGYRPAVDGVGRMITSAFVHGGWLHLLGNMLFLYLCGANLEDRWSRPGFAGFYLVGAIVAAFTFKLWHPASLTPLIGASGAVAAGMGAFLVVFTTTRVRMFYAYWLTFKPKAGTFEIPAYAALGFWFAMQAFYAWFEAYLNMDVAYSAHVGGFVFGVATAGVFKVSGLDSRLEDRAEKASELFNEDERYVSAMRALGQGDKAGAAAMLKEVLAEDPDHGAAREALFRLALELDDERRVTIDASWYVVRAVDQEEWDQAAGTYYTLRDRYSQVTLDDRALAAVAVAGNKLSNSTLVVEATRDLMNQFPKSPRVPAAMLESAEAQSNTGRRDLALKTLRNIVATYPQDPAAAVARERIDSNLLFEERRPEPASDAPTLTDPDDG